MKSFVEVVVVANEGMENRLPKGVHLATGEEVAVTVEVTVDTEVTLAAEDMADMLDMEVSISGSRYNLCDMLSTNSFSFSFYI